MSTSHTTGWRKVSATAAVMIGILLASMEATMVTTAMPTIIGHLGGLQDYSWVFSGYMLASTTPIPLYGKFSDLFGRRRVFLAAMSVFLVGSVLCGLATSMTQLVLARCVQGLGAGGLLPLGLIIVGDIFSYVQRARMQGLFAAVWGASSVVGPLLGGILVDRVAWQWVFYINILPGLAAAALVWVALADGGPRPAFRPVHVDYAGAGLLAAAAVALLLGLLKIDQPAGWVLIGASAGLAVALVRVEQRAVEPTVPLHLFGDRLFAVACAHGLLAGWAVFGSLTFVPLFVQGVLGANATRAGTTLMPMVLAWGVASAVSGWLLLRLNYRILVWVGGALPVVGCVLLAAVGPTSSQSSLMLDLALIGIGMGLSMPVFTILVQSAVERRWLGIATSTLQFSRSIGGALGVSVMGAALSLWLAQALGSAGLDPSAAAVNSLLQAGSLQAAAGGAARAALSSALRGVFGIGLVGAVLALAATVMTPNGHGDTVVRRGQPVAEAKAWDGAGDE